MICYAELVTANGGSTRAFTVIQGNITSGSDRVVFEQGGDYWALKIDGEYAMIYDVDGLLIGDLESGQAAEYPRLDIYGQWGSMTQRMATLSKTGRIQTPVVEEVTTLPTTGGMNLFNDVWITPDGVFAEKINEVWFLTDNGGNYLCDNGMLIQVNPVPQPA
jgi:hypothetical protein